MKTAPLTLRSKTLLITGALLLFLILLLYVTFSAIMLGEFAEVEKKDTEKNVKRVIEALSDELSALTGYAGDFAAWDESYEFVENPDYSYIDRNLPDESVFDMDLNLFLIMNSSGGILFMRGYDLQNETQASVSENLKDHISATSPLVQHRDKDSTIAGIIMLPEGPMLIISRPILDNERKKPIRGAMIWGRYLNAEKIARLENKTHLSIAVQRYDDLQMHSDFQTARDSLSGTAQIIVQPLSEGSIAGYTVMKDIYGMPALLLRIETQRPIYNQAQASVGYLLMSLIVIAFVFGILSVGILDKLILTRLTRLNTDVRRIGASGKLSERVRIEGRDELSRLASSINIMLEGQERAEAESRRAEEIRLENERLMDAKKAKSEFLANMNRKVRTPLTPIIGFAELLNKKQQGELDENQERYAENILSSSKHLFGIISRILDISSIDEGKLELIFEKISVMRVLDEILDLVKEKARNHNVILKKEIEPAVEYIEADPVRLKQILFNLLSNAVNFSKPEGGTVNIIAKKEGDMAKISVADTGIGIKEEDKDRLFKEFEQLDSGITKKYEGAGIGLAMTKRLVELHGGKIMVESKYGEGTTFTFLLPLRRDRNGTDAA